MLSMDDAAESVPLDPPQMLNLSFSPRAPRSNWFHPARFSAIDSIAKLHRFQNLQAIINELQKGTAGQPYRSLHRGTLTKWIDHENRCWTAKTLEKVQLAAATQDKHDAPHVVAPDKAIGRPSFLVRTKLCIAPIRLTYIYIDSLPYSS